MKTIATIVTGLTLALSLSSCMEHQNALCTDANAVEIEGLAGTKSFRYMSNEGTMESAQVAFTYLGDGVYKNEGKQSQASRACRLGDRFAFETQSESGGYSVLIIERLGDNGFLFSAPALDLVQLNKAGIRYEVVNDEAEESFSALSSNLPLNMISGQVEDDEIRISMQKFRIFNETAEQTEVLKSLYEPSSFGISLR